MITDQSATPPIDAGPRVGTACVTCGAVRSGPFCGQCGQRHVAGRQTLRGFAAGVLRRAVGEEGALVTVKQLAVRPGQMIRDYLAGRTVRYVHPATYLLLAAAVFALVSSALGGATGAGESDRLFALLVIPIVAAACRVLFWRGAYNYAEHLIAVTYLAAQALLLLVLLYCGTLLVPQIFVGWFAAVSIVLSTAYFSWGYSQIFEQRPVLAAGGALAALLVGVVVWLGITMVIVAVLRR